MGRRRGVSRRSFARRRIRRIKAKWDDTTIPRRFKKTMAARVDELEWETLVLLELEVQIFDVLTNWSVPSDQWPYYVGFGKRVWERAMKFTDATFQLEKQSLLNEYVLRGHVQGVLEAVQVHAEAMADIKKGYLMPPAWAYDTGPAGLVFAPAAWTYDDVVGKIFMQEYGGYDNRGGEIQLGEPEGINGGGYDNRQ